jgi:hypothetical protein
LHQAKLNPWLIFSVIAYDAALGRRRDRNGTTINATENSATAVSGRIAANAGIHAKNC